jgi:hypothetical protein
VIQGKALETLKGRAIETGSSAARCLGAAIREERAIRGERDPAQSIVEIVREEHRRLLVPADEADEWAEE